MCITGCDNDPSNRDDETDDDFPPIEDLLSQISREGISTRGCRNLEDTLQHVPEPILDTSGSHPSPASSRLDDGIGGSQGTRGMRDRSLFTVAGIFISLTIRRQTSGSRR
jgi:hypothetical protein